MKSVYIATRFANKPAARNLQRALIIKGVTPASTWVTGLPDCTEREAAHIDLRDVERADTVVLLTVGCDVVPGGMHFEAGYAFALGKHIILVGPPVHIFCRLAHQEFDSVEAFLQSL